MTSERRLTLTTPEGLRFDLRLAGPAQRCLALAIDLAAVGAAISLVSTGVGLIFGASFYGAALLTLLEFVLSVGYGIALEWFWRGQTLGKRVFKLRVVDARGLPLTPPQVVTRNLMRVIDALPLLYLAGGAAAVLNRHFQRLGDMLASTVVVCEAGAPAGDFAALRPEKFNSMKACTVPAYRIRQIATPAETRLLVAALLRRQEFDAPARLGLYRELRDYFEARVRFPEEITAPLSDEHYLQNLAGILLPARLA